MESIVFVLLCWILILNVKTVSMKYEPNWASLDARPLPSWYDEAKIGIFIHWGVFSVPSFRDEWFWERWKTNETDCVDFMKENYPPNFAYADFAHSFRAELYDPIEWASLFEKSGAKYVVFVSKHHEGFTNWPSKYSFNWNSMDVGPKRDILGDFADAIREKTKLKFGIYHSWYEWFNPLYLRDKANDFQTNTFVTQKTYPELLELVTQYKPELIWSDGDWEAPSWYWNSTEFLAWLYNESPVRDTVVVNDRWGIGTFCHHGGYWNCKDRFHPSQLISHKWENAFTLDQSSWGFNRRSDASKYFQTSELLLKVVSTVAYGGNALINIGPTHDGRIIPVFQNLLLDMGKWLNINGEAIYGSHICPFQNDSLTSNVYYTCQKQGPHLYATFFDWPSDGILDLGSLACPFDKSAVMLGIGKISCQGKPGVAPARFDLSGVAIKVLAKKMNWAWTMKL